jgi:hypothetical protein
LKHARAEQLLSADHFTVDGTLIEAWAGQKSFQRKEDKTRRRPTKEAVGAAIRG